MLKVNVFAGAEVTYQAWEGVPENLLQTNRTFNPYTYDNQVDDYKQNHYQLIYTNLQPKLESKRSIALYLWQRLFEQFRPNDRLSNYALNPVIIGDTVYPEWISFAGGGWTTISMEGFFRELYL